MIASNTTEKKIVIRIRRQDAPGKAQRWEEFSIPYRPNMNIISCLQYIAANPITTEGKDTTPPVWDAGCLEEVCGACTMVINGKVRQSCSALVDHLTQPITLEPMTKFPLVRDLFVDRNRLFNDLKRIKAWVPIDGTYDLGPGPALSEDEQEERYPLSRCISAVAAWKHARNIRRAIILSVQPFSPRHACLTATRPVLHSRASGWMC